MQGRAMTSYNIARKVAELAVMASLQGHTYSYAAVIAIGCCATARQVIVSMPENSYVKVLLSMQMGVYADVRCFPLQMMA